MRQARLITAMFYRYVYGEDSEEQHIACLRTAMIYSYVYQASWKPCTAMVYAVSTAKKLYAVSIAVFCEWKISLTFRLSNQPHPNG